MGTEKQPEEHLYPIVISEINFLTLPFFNLARKGLADTDRIEYTKTIQRGNEMVDITW